MRLLTFAWASLVCLACGSAFGAEEIKHSFFVAGPTFTGIIDEDGKEAWDAGRPGARDGYVIANGNVVIAWSDEVKSSSSLATSDRCFTM